MRLEVSGQGRMDVPDEPKLTSVASTAPRECISNWRKDKISMEDAIDFVFCKKLKQHPQTTGRLLAYGLYGPLDASHNLRSGQGGTHVVQGWELDAMCAQFEREDLVQIYLPFGYPTSTLSHAETQAVIGQADAKFKTAKGKSLMPQVKEAEVRALFKPLPTTEDGLYSFHDLQQQVLKTKSIARLEKEKDKAKEKSNTQGSVAPVTLHDAPRLAVKAHPSSCRVSEQCAPPTMFLKDKGLRDEQIPDQTNLLLSHKAFKIAELRSLNSPDLCMNVRLLREEGVQRRRLVGRRGNDKNYSSNNSNKEGWDQQGYWKGSQVGSHVRCARSSTTCKRHVTIAGMQEGGGALAGSEHQKGSTV